MKKVILTIAAIGLVAAVGLSAGTLVDTADIKDNTKWCWLVWCA